jgi:hypothetical protein
VSGELLFVSTQPLFASKTSSFEFWSRSARRGAALRVAARGNDLWSRSVRRGAALHVATSLADRLVTA